MEKKKKTPFLQLVPANLHAFESTDQEEQKDDFNNDSNNSENDVLKEDPIIEMFGDEEIGSTIKNNRLTQESQDDESSEDELFKFKSQDPCIKKIKNSKTTQKIEFKPIEKKQPPTETPKKQIIEKTTKNPSPTSTSTPKKQNKSKQVSPNSGKQRKIFEFGKVTNLPKEDPDDFYDTIQQIYAYFNNKKSIPLILSVIHQSAGNIYEAIHRLAYNVYEYNEESIDLSYSSICSVSDDLAKYFL